MSGGEALLRRRGVSARGEAYLIRPAREQDAPALVALHDLVAAEGGHIAAVPGDRSVMEEELALAGLLNGGGLSLVAEVDGALAGSILVQRFQTRYHRHLGELAIVVDRRHRRAGLGRALMATAVEWAGRVGIGKLCLTVFPDNRAAIALYRSYGFEEEGLRRRQVRLPDGDRDVLSMGLLISG